MSAVHGPMPCSAVSAACAASASIRPTASRSICPLAIAVPIAFIVLIFGRRQAEPRRAARRASAARVSWWNGSNAAATPSPDRGRARGRKLLAADDAAQTGEAGLAPAQPGHAGLGEHRRKRGSCATSAAIPAARSASVWMNDVMRVGVTAPSASAPERSGRRRPAGRNVRCPATGNGRRASACGSRPACRTSAAASCTACWPSVSNANASRGRSVATTWWCTMSPVLQNELALRRDHEGDVADRVSRRRDRLDAGQDFLSVLEEHDAVPVRQQLLARADDHPAKCRVGHFAFVGPEFEVGLRHVDLRVREVAGLGIGHQAEAMVGMGVGERRPHRCPWDRCRRSCRFASSRPLSFPIILKAPSPVSNSTSWLPVLITSVFCSSRHHVGRQEVVFEAALHLLLRQPLEHIARRRPEMQRPVRHDGAPRSRPA